MDAAGFTPEQLVKVQAMIQEATKKDKGKAKQEEATAAGKTVRRESPAGQGPACRPRLDAPAPPRPLARRWWWTSRPAGAGRAR